MQTSVIDATSITNVGTSPIGAGAYAVVYRARYDGDPVVIKRMKHFEHASDVVIKAFKEEAAIFSRLNHARIVRFFGVIIEKDCLSLVLEEMTHGNLFDLYRSQPKASVQDRIQWSLDIAFGVHYLHTRSPPIIHRDLKSMNVLMSAGVNGALRAKVTDFGSAVSQLALETQSQLEKPTLVGTTLYWRAPELRRESPQFTTATDVYSYGIILTEVISWVGPFGVPVSQLNPRHMEALHGQGRSMTPDLTEADVSQEYKTIAMNCSVDNPEVRPAFPDIVKALEGLPDIQEGNRLERVPSTTSVSLENITNDSNVISDTLNSSLATEEFDVLATYRPTRPTRETQRTAVNPTMTTSSLDTTLTAQFDVLATSRSNRYPSGRGTIRNNLRVDHGTTIEPTIETGAIRNNVRVDYGTMLGDDNSDEILRVEIPTITLLEKSSSAFYHIYNQWQHNNDPVNPVVLLKSRIDHLLPQIKEVLLSPSDLQKALRPVTELALRLTASILSAHMLVERFTAYPIQVIISENLQSAFKAVDNEFTNCEEDLRLIFVKLKMPESRTVDAEMTEIRRRAKQAMENAIVGMIQHQRTNHGVQQFIPVDTAHINRDPHNQTTIQPQNVSQYTLLHKGRHKIEKCVYRVAHGPPKPCVFKYASQRSMLIENESSALRILSTSPYFPKCFGVFQRDANSYGVLLEYVGDTDTPLSLREYLRDNIVEWSERLRFMRQITLAVALMSQHNMIHGNITTTNILLQLNYQTHQHDIKIIDFNDTMHNQPSTAPLPDIPNRVQDHPFFAPELFQNSPPTLKSDIYALGTVLWELTYCAIPYSHIPPHTIRTRILHHHHDGLPKGPNTGAPESLTSLISHCWSPNPFTRPSANQVNAAVMDIYQINGNRATPVIPEHMNSLDAWRDAYLRIRGGLSIENLICVRILHAFYSQSALPLTYHPIDAATRQAIPCFLLKLAVAKYRDGGAAYKLMECGGMEEKDRWLKLGVELGHPKSMEVYYRALYKDRRIAKEAYMELGKRWMTWRADGERVDERRREQMNLF